MKERRADVTPRAAALIESLRDVGYSFATAVADIIDNSITAGARTVEILTASSVDEPYVAIVDDGCGMSEEELIAAMRPGSKNPLAARNAGDLGRFGLGLKSASFSQCRCLTVASRRDGVTSVAVWDLDEIAERNDWSINLVSSVDAIPGLVRLGTTGTVVVWQKLDRLTGEHSSNSPRRAEIINQTVAESERHLRIVFHRFMQESPKIQLRLNGRAILPLDPFATRHPATIADPEESIALPRGSVTIQSYTIPHHQQLSSVEWEEL